MFAILLAVAGLIAYGFFLKFAYFRGRAPDQKPVDVGELPKWGR